MVHSFGQVHMQGIVRFTKQIISNVIMIFLCIVCWLVLSKLTYAVHSTVHRADICSSSMIGQLCLRGQVLFYHIHDLSIDP